MGSGHSGPINVEVVAADRLVIKVYGPDWLRFYFTGWSAHTITGREDNIASRGMLVFYNSSGDKIVTRSVNIPGRAPGLYVEKAVEDAVGYIKSLASTDVETYFSNLERERQNALNQVELSNRDQIERQTRKLQDLRRQLKVVYNPLEWDTSKEESELDYAEEDLKYELRRRDSKLSEARRYAKMITDENKRRSVLFENEAIEAYLQQYAFGMIIQDKGNITANSKKFASIASNITTTTPRRSARLRVKKVEGILREKGIIK